MGLGGVFWNTKFMIGGKVGAYYLYGLEVVSFIR